MLMFMWAKQYIKLLSENFSAVAATAVSRRSRQSNPIRALTGQSLMLRPGSLLYYHIILITFPHLIIIFQLTMIYVIILTDPQQSNRVDFHPNPPFSSTFNHFRRLSNHFHQLITTSSTFNYFHPHSFIFNHLHPLSFKSNPFHPLSTISSTSIQLNPPQST